MKIIIVLLVAIAGAFWFFHGRGSRATVPPSVREAAAQTKVAITATETAAAEVARTRAVTPESSTLERIVAGEKMREQSPAATAPVSKPASSAAYDLILRGERIVENKRAASQ